MENLFNKLMDESEAVEDDFSTPQSVAWKLLTDDYHEDLSAALLAFSPDISKEEDPASFSFEMLLTICLELISHMALIMHTDDNTTDNDVTLTRKDYHFEDFFTQIKKILGKVSILFSFNKYDNNNNDYTIKKILDGRYCRVVFRHNKKDRIYFDRNDVPDDVNYHFILNESYEFNSDLRNIYAIIVEKDIIYKLSFDKISKIASMRCA